MLPEYNFVKMRVFIEKSLGAETIKSLHVRNPWLEWLALFGIATVFSTLMYLLSHLPFSLLWVACLVLQGFVIQIINIFAHDNCTHYAFAGKLSYYLDCICCFTAMRLPSQYKEFHMLHHRYLNSEKDPEMVMIGKMGKATPLKRLLSFTFFIFFMVPAFEDNVPYSQEALKKIKFEKKLLFGFFAFIALALIVFPAITFYGYVLPVLISVPIASMSRVLLEHADIENGDTYQIATYYRTNWLTRLLFFFASGDCHLVHHFYPNIPYYHMTRAVKLFRPLMLEKGVREHRSFFKIHYDFLFKNKPIRGSWANA